MNFARLRVLFTFVLIEASTISNFTEICRFVGPASIGKPRYKLTIADMFSDRDMKALKTGVNYEFIKGEISDFFAVHPFHVDIEKTPVEARLSLIDKSINRPRRLRQGIFLTFGNFLEYQYKRYLARLSYIDACVLRFLKNTIVSDIYDRPDKRPVSAASIIEHFQREYPDGRFAYLTPEYLYDWIPLLGRNFFAESLDVRKDIAEMMILGESKFCGTDRFLLDLGNFDWKRILQNRRERLVRTGYDTI